MSSFYNLYLVVWDNSLQMKGNKSNKKYKLGYTEMAN